MVRFVVLICVLLPATSLAQRNAKSHNRLVTTLLMSKFGFPSRAQLLRTGTEEDTNRVLTDLTINRKAALRLRLHAMRALEYYPTKRSEEVLMTMLFARKQLSPVKRVAMRVLARAFGVKMLFELIPFVRDPDPRMRSAASKALAEIDDGRVRNVLNNALVSEPDIVVRTAIEQALDTISEREKRRKNEGLPRHDRRNTLH
ncbi:MAG: HEAT repeat protein [Myxococcota bacterium]|jgi:HEAT repeat protein